MLTTGTNTNLVPDLSNKGEIYQLEKTEKRGHAKEATSSPQAIRNGEIEKRLVTPEEELKVREGIRTLKGNLRVVIVDND